jgi:putative addiction module component (TIGR02574 family)
MARPLPIPPPGFDDLSVEDQLDYVHSLWDRIVAHPEAVPVPDWHRRVLEERLAAHRADPGATVPWGEVRDDLLRKLNDRRTRG